MKKAVLALVAAVACSTAGAVEVTVRIPADPNVDPSGDFGTPYHLSSQRWGTDTRQEKIIVLDKGNGDVVINRRVDNGTAGSGRMYRLKATTAPSAKSNELTFATTSAEPYEYREGLIGRFPVPAFTDGDLEQFLRSGYVAYKLELNADFPVDAIAANFARLAKGHASRGGKYVGEATVSGAPVEFSYEIMPYRNGSKAVINAVLKPEAQTTGVVDFGPVVEEFKKSMAAIVNA